MSDEKQNSDEQEQGFNDSELQDIMEEIESLEKEFSSDAPEAESEESTPPVSEAVDDKSDLQKAIDQEVEDLERESIEDEVSAEAPEEHQVEAESDDVFNDADFEEDDEDQTVTSIHSGKSAQSPQQEMQLKASGPMNIELDFPVGEHKAHFKVLPHGFCVEYEGVEIHVDENEGCHIEMPGGAQFRLPMKAAKVKKAS